MDIRCLFVAVLFNVCSFVVSQGSTICIDKTEAVKENSIEITCPGDGGLITFAVFTTGRGNCLDETCIGDTPNFMVETAECYWKKTCAVQLRTEQIVRSQSSECIGRSPQFLRLQHYRCFLPQTEANEKNEMVETVGIVTFDDEDNQSVSYKSGVLRSHNQYPWNYVYEGKTTMKITLTFQRESKLLMSVQDIELGQDDKLTVRQKRKPAINLENNHSVEFTRGTEATVEFSVSADSNGARGFVVCFKFVKKWENVTDACEKLQTESETNYVSDTPYIPRFLLETETKTPLPVETTKAPATTTKRPKGCRRGKKKGKSCKKRGGRKGRKGKKGRNKKRKGKKNRKKDKKKNGKGKNKDEKKASTSSAPNITTTTA